MSMNEDHYIFGYGSLIWKVDFPYEIRTACYIKGYVRRFWQGSTPESPGRVVTLLPYLEYQKFRDLDPHPADYAEKCYGIAYKIARKDVDSVEKHLLHREKDGYTTHYAPIFAINSKTPLCNAVIYMANSTNVSFVGPQPIQDIAELIARNRGPSGLNRDYLFGLHEALSLIAPGSDIHVETLAKLVTEIVKKSARSEKTIHQ